MHRHMQGSVFYISKSRKYYMPRIKEMVKSIQIYPFTGTRMLDKQLSKCLGKALNGHGKTCFT